MDNNTGIKRIDVFKDENIPDARGIKVELLNGKTVTYNTHEYSVYVTEVGFHPVYLSNVLPDQFWEFIAGGAQHS